eukprot:Em0010g375a
MAAEKDQEVLIKVVLAGDFDVGKTCLLNQFTERSFSNLYSSTIGTDIKIKTLNIDGKLVKLQIWDTAGQERFKTLTRTYYRQAKAAMLVYSVTNEKSFEDVRDWMSDIDEIAGHSVVKVIVGNKADNSNDVRTVSYERGRKLSSQCGCEFIEVSAKTGMNVEQAFVTLARNCIKLKKPQEAEKGEKHITIMKNPTLKRTHNGDKVNKKSCC